MEARYSTDRSASWSDPVAVASNVSNIMTPLRTRAGRLILPGNLSFPWTDDPLGLSGWTWAGVPGMQASVVDTYYNMAEINRLAGTGQSYTEACCFERDDGVIVAMLRNERRGIFRLGACQSLDCGATWSKPVLTQFTDAVARSHFGRLPDGRYFAVSCPAPPSDGRTHGVRTPLVLALSDDGIVFDRHYIVGQEPEAKPRLEGLFKVGRYGYPYFLCHGGKGYVIYSVNKEDVAVGIFDLAQLD